MCIALISPTGAWVLHWSPSWAPVSRHWCRRRVLDRSTDFLCSDWNQYGFKKRLQSDILYLTLARAAISIMFVATNTCLSRQKRYLWQLPPMICIRWSLFRRDDAVPAALWPQSRVRESARPSDSGLRGGLRQRSVGDYLWWQLGRPGRLRHMSHGGTQSVSTAHICCLVHPLLNQSVSQSVSLFFFFFQSVSLVHQSASLIHRSVKISFIGKSVSHQSVSFIHPLINVIYLSFSLK